VIAAAAVLLIPFLTLGFGMSPFALLKTVRDWVDEPLQRRAEVNENGAATAAAASRPLSGQMAQVVPEPTAVSLPTLHPVALPTDRPAAVRPGAPTWINGIVAAAGGVRVNRAIGVESPGEPLLAPGTPVLLSPTGVIRSRGREWRSIRSGNGAVGWVPADAVVPSGAATTALQPQATATATAAADTTRARVSNTDGLGVVLRASPRMEDRTPRGLLEGATVTVVERSGSDWFRVRGDNGLEGWVPARYLTGMP
jgi:SH3-like domain-containing protein